MFQGAGSNTPVSDTRPEAARQPPDGDLGGIYQEFRHLKRLSAAAVELNHPPETFRSLLGGELEMRFGGNPIEGSNPSLSATPSATKPQPSTAGVFTLSGNHLFLY